MPTKRTRTFEERIYEKQILCSGCSEPLVAKVLLNSYSQEFVEHPHIELVCQSCSYGRLLKIKPKQEEKFRVVGEIKNAN